MVKTLRLALFFFLIASNLVLAQKGRERFDPNGSFWIIGEAPSGFSDFSAINLNARRVRHLPSPGLQLNNGRTFRFQQLSVKQEKFTFVTGTVGGGIAVRDLVDQVKFMRRYRGAHVYAVVSLANTFMHTRFGGRQRPHFAIKDWFTFGGGDAEQAALPKPTSPGGAQTVAPSSAKEVTDDEIRF